MNQKTISSEKALECANQYASKVAKTSSLYIRELIKEQLTMLILEQLESDPKKSRNCV